MNDSFRAIQLPFPLNGGGGWGQILYYVLHVIHAIVRQRAGEDLGDLLVGIDPDRFRNDVAPGPLIEEGRRANRNVVEALRQCQAITPKDATDFVDIFGEELVIAEHQLFARVKFRLQAEGVDDLDQLLLEVQQVAAAAIGAVEIGRDIGDGSQVLAAREGSGVFLAD